jgi:hypothetical protein
MFISSLMRSFPAFDGWPETCKAGALDLIYGVGVSGFQQYHHFISACLAENWQMAADQCASDANIAAYDARNAARKQLFLDAFSDPSS